MATAATDQPQTGRIYAYFGPFTLLVYLVLPHGYLIDITTTFMLKNQLHATAPEVSVFRLLIAIPVYVSFVFGLARDLWNPFGMRDRGFLLIFAPATAAVFVWMAFTQLSYWGLFAGLFLVMATFRFVAAAYWGLIALIGQDKLMSGRLSALWNIVSSIPYVAGAAASGWIADNLSPRQTFLLVAALALALAVFGLWKPASVFARVYDRPRAKGADFVRDLKRLVRHRAAYPAVLILFLFQFSPGSNTPLQFYLTDKLHASDAVYGYYYAAFAVSFIPMFFLYAWLCKRVKLNKLLWWGTVITVPQMVPLAFIHTGMQAVYLAVPIGMMGGIATSAYMDFAMRACPPGLQGTLMMLVDGFLMLSYRGGDWLGAKIYAASPDHGFAYCVIATTAVYVLILPCILLIPRALIATADGEANPAVERAVLQEVAETA